MSSGRPLLSLGDGAGPVIVDSLLSSIHADRPITVVLFGQGGVVASYVSRWAGDGNRCTVEPWPGIEAIRRCARPPCTGIDRLYALLRDVAGLEPRPIVVIWGEIPAFWLSKRRREWDVPADLAMAICQRAGLDGWVVVGGQVMRFEGEKGGGDGRAGPPPP